MDDNRSQQSCGRVAPSVNEDDTLNLSGDKDAVIKQIDALHEQHRLQKLRELVEPYRHMGCLLTKKDAENMEVEELICALWQDGDNIPPELTFGEPYDSTFRAFITRQHTSWDYVSDILYLLFQYANQLPMYLVYILEDCNAWNDHNHIKRINEEIWNKIPSLSHGGPLTATCELQSALKNTTLSRLERVYIAVTLEKILYSQCDLRVFVKACMR